MKMATKFEEQVIGIPISSVAFSMKNSVKGYLPDPARQYYISSTSNGPSTNKQSRRNSVLKRMNKLGKKADNFAHGVREHVRLGPKITETLKGKLNMAAKIVQSGGVEKIFKHVFSVRQGEKLLKASQCYLSTTAGPIAGLLFISTDKVAFCSERTLKFSSPNGELDRVHYKVLIPLGKIKCVNQSENVKMPSQKYIQIVTVDDFEFWFMGFLNYEKAFVYLQQAISNGH